MKKEIHVLEIINQQHRGQKGITLIALIITIIVLLILAGVTINLTLGENGIFKTAQGAAKNYTQAQNEELTALEEFTNEADKIIANVTGGSTPTTPTTPTSPTLVSQITPEDYGKAINYSVTVDGTELSDWKVFYNDGNNVYIILSDYLPNSLIPEATGMTTSKTYNANWSTSSVSTNEEAVATLTNTTYWSAFAGGRGGSTATGSPTGEMLMASYNAKHNTSLVYTNSPNIGTTDSLYVPHTSGYEDCYRYWLASFRASNSGSVWHVNYDGDVDIVNYFLNAASAVRPVVCLTSDITGTVGDTVTISE